MANGQRSETMHNRTIRKLKSVEKDGERIKGNKFFRAFCHRCKEPLRVSNPTIIEHWCELCSPPHQGCSSPPSPNDDSC